MTNVVDWKVKCIPVLSAFGLLVAFVVMIVILRRGVHYFYTFTAGAAIIGLTGGLPPMALLQTMGLALVSPNGIKLSYLVFLVTILSHALEHGNFIDDLIGASRRLFGSAKRAMLVITNFVGAYIFVPGAVTIAAPAVERAASSLPPGGKAALSVLYHYFIRMAIPFVPSFILVAQLAGIEEVGAIIKYQLLAAAVGMIVTYLLYLWKAPEAPLGVLSPSPEEIPPHETEIEVEAESLKNRAKSPGRPGDLFRFWVAAAPLAISLALVYSGVIQLGASLVLALALVLILAFFLKKKNPINLMRPNWSLMATIFGIIILQGVLNETESLNSIIGPALESGVPIEPLVILLPLVVAYLAGSQNATVATVYLVLLPAFAAAPNRAIYTAMFYVSGTIGFVLSPINIDQAVAREFFNAKPFEFYRAAALPLASFLGAMAILFLLFR